MELEPQFLVKLQWFNFVTIWNNTVHVVNNEFWLGDTVFPSEHNLANQGILFLLEMEATLLIRTFFRVLKGIHSRDFP